MILDWQDPFENELSLAPAIFCGFEAKRRRRRRSGRTHTICQNKCLFFVLAVRRVRGRERGRAPLARYG